MMTAEKGPRTVWPGGGWMTLQEAAGYLRISERHLKRLLKRGDIGKVQARPGCTVWISVDSCDRYLNIQGN